MVKVGIFGIEPYNGGVKISVFDDTGKVVVVNYANHENSRKLYSYIKRCLECSEQYGEFLKGTTLDNEMNGKINGY